MERIRDVEQMPIHRLFEDLAFRVEESTRRFGPEFRWLRVQVLRSSESVCANLAEGFYAQYSTEYAQSLHRCRREARESIAHIRYAKGVGQLDETLSDSIISSYVSALVQLARLISAIEKKIIERGKGKDLSCIVREEPCEYEVDSCEYA